MRGGNATDACGGRAQFAYERSYLAGDSGAHTLYERERYAHQRPEVVGASLRHHAEYADIPDGSEIFIERAARTEPFRGVFYFADAITRLSRWRSARKAAYRV